MQCNGIPSYDITNPRLTNFRYWIFDFVDQNQNMFISNLSMINIFLILNKLQNKLYT